MREGKKREGMGLALSNCHLLVVTQTPCRRGDTGDLYVSCDEHGVFNKYSPEKQHNEFKKQDTSDGNLDRTDMRKSKIPFHN